MTPNVLVISGHDPSGGAGLVADIQTISACGAKEMLLVDGLVTKGKITKMANYQSKK